MIEELTEASALLHSAMDRYLKACVGIKKSYGQGKSSSILPELSSRLSRERQSLPLIEAKLKEASVAINWTRNLSKTLVPVNNLPPELLAHIFQLLLGWQSRAERVLGSLNGQTRKYPAALSHVCSHWRRVAINSCSLWTHIELCTLDTAHQGLIDRAETYVNRAGSLLLDVRLTDPPSPGGPRYSHAAKLEMFFIPFAARVRSLELVLQNKYPRRLQYSTLSTFLNNCVPGTFTEFIASTNRVNFDKTGSDEIEDYTPISFIRTSESSNHDLDVNLFLNVDQSRLEHILHSLTVLRLNLIYPTWSSMAYHGLIELRLTGEAYIPEDSLVAMLGSSPGLRLLVLAVDIASPVQKRTPVSPVPLRDLEALHIHGVNCDELGSLLRWLAPGPKPLQITLNGSHEDKDFYGFNIQAFFNRSNVTQIYASCVNRSGVNRLLRLCPRLETLVIEESDFACTSTDGILSIKLPSLCALYMLHCTFEAEELLELVKVNNLRTLVCYDCPLYPSQDDVMEEFSAHCPDIRCSFLADRHPIEEWDAFENFEWWKPPNFPRTFDQSPHIPDSFVLVSDVNLQSLEYSWQIGVQYSSESKVLG